MRHRGEEPFLRLTSGKELSFAATSFCIDGKAYDDAIGTLGEVE